ncbi:MAG: LAGLIDADG family homing endonuclease [Candidatus Methylomirabilia bacterium]
MLSDTRPASHKCLVGETLVMTDTGLTRLAEVVAGTSVMTDEGPFGVSALRDNGDQPVFEVRTHCALKVGGTAEHRLLVVGSDGAHLWRTIGEIEEGDWLVVKPGFWNGGQTKLPEFAVKRARGGNGTSVRIAEHPLPQELTPELAELIGLYVADGSNHRDGIRFTVGADSLEIVQKIEELSLQLFGKKPRIYAYRNARAVEVSILSARIRQWFDFLGIAKAASGEAHAPQIILRSPEVVASAFARGLFTADGCIGESGHITLATPSERLAEEVQVMMLALGIPTHLRLDVAETGYRSYQLSVCTKAGFRAFREKIGFLDPTRQARLVGADERQIFGKGEGAPNQRRWLRAWYDAVPRGVRAHAKVLFGDILHRVRDPREITQQAAAAVMERPSALAPVLKELPAEDCFFVRVTAIVYVGIRRVYDLTVPLKHAYLASGFVAHNSGG